MRRFRFNISSLLAVVLFLAVAFAALREATDLWDSGVFTLAAGLLLASVLLAVHRTGRRRAIWSGFALFGGAYLAASLIPPVESRLLTTKALTYLDSKIPGRTLTFTVSFTAPSQAGTQNVAFSPSGQTLTFTSSGAVRIWNAAAGLLMSGPGGTSENFVRIGHSVLALALAYVGGRLSRWLYDRRGGPSEVDPGRESPRS
jgi:hypothetical protein